MTIKKLFDPASPYTILNSTNVADIGREVESSGNVVQRFIQKNRFLPKVEYNDPANFAFYGSAQEYYQSSIERVLRQYPYDGSWKEQVQYQNESTFFDIYIFENMYPRTTGYSIFSPNGWGTQVTSSVFGGGGDIIGKPSLIEYVQVVGGPHAAPDEYADDSLKTQFEYSNIYDPSENRESNLKCDFDEGVTVEFWMNKPSGSLMTGSTAYEVITQLSNEASGTLLMALHTSASTDATAPRLLLAAADGTDITAISPDGFNAFSFFTNETICDGKWHHYAFTFQNSGSGFYFSAYYDGEFIGKNPGMLGPTPTGPLVEVSGALKLNVGASRKFLYDLGGGLNLNFPDDGWCKLSGSLDEFRYWKKARTSKQIGQHWFTQVGGGTNTDDANTDLGVYFKFNEGITLSSSIDSIVLDYSGRISNGAWTGYTSAGRSTGSAIDIYYGKEIEFKDPIIYSFHPEIITLQNNLNKSGSVYDLTNNASLYHSIPSWIVEDDENEGGQDLRKLTQIMGSYMDTLQLQIQSLPDLKNVSYDFVNNKPVPFAHRLLEGMGFVAPEIFVEAPIISQILNQDYDFKFDLDLGDLKNLIYKNIYNNLVNIYKTKGTEKSFRNLIHCYGIDENLVRLNLYGDGVNYQLRNNYRYISMKRKYAAFNAPTRFGATIYQQTSSGNPNSTSFISASNFVGAIGGAAQEEFTSFTLETEIIFPRDKEKSHPEYFPTPFLTSSLFGFHTAKKSTPSDLTWGDPDSYVEVYAIRNELESKNTYFQFAWVTGSEPTPFLVSSSLFYDVYDNQKWNFALRFFPDRYGANLVSGSGEDETDYTIELYGVHSEAGVILNEFSISASLPETSPSDQESRFLWKPKRIYAGALRTNFTGAVVHSSDIKLGSVRYWTSYLDNDVIQLHNRDPSSYGTLSPYKSTYLYPTSLSGVIVPQDETLALHWAFDTVTSSDDGPAGLAGYEVPDLSSGSLELTDRYKWLGNVVKMQHPGRGDFYLPNETNVVDIRYVYADKQRLPEVLQSSDMVSIEETDNVFTRESRPINYYYGIEKSMYQNISDEIINVFATIAAFNNLIGEPVNRYRRNYKNMEKLRALFFESVGNIPDLDKYIEFYKWIDASLDIMLQKLIPASANASDDIRTMVESHILERNKYQSKFPTLEMEAPLLEGGINGINELLYNWKYGHAPISPNPDGLPTSPPISPDPQNENCFWWKERAEREGPWPFAPGDILSSSDAGVNTDRVAYLSASLQALNRSFTTPYHFVVDEALTLHGGVNYSPNKKIDYVKETIKFGTTTGVTVEEIKSPVDCTDIYNPSEKIKLNFKATTNDTSYFSGKGSIFVPFSLYSSSLYNDITSGSRITNLHTDTYGNDMDIPMQGPFTEDLVGGLQSRHVAALSASSAATRPEGWNLSEASVTFPNTKALQFSQSSPASNDGDELEWEDYSWKSGNPDETDKFTISFWCNPATYGLVPNAGGGTFVSNFPCTLIRVGQLTDAGHIRLTEKWTSGGGGGGLVNWESPNGLIPDNTWSHVVVSHDASDPSNSPVLYLNGISQSFSLDTAAPAGTLVAPTSTTARMGTGAGSATKFSGSLDEVALWKRAMSAEDVLQIYNGGCVVDLASESPLDLISWWRMGDTPGDADAGGIIYDVVGDNNATGSFGAAPTIGPGPMFTTNVVPGCIDFITEVLKFTYPDVSKPRAVYYREPLAKRPVNIQNKKIASLGNYLKDYEIVQTCGRYSNNRAFVSSSGFDVGPIEIPFVRNTGSYNANDLPKIERGRTPYVFVNRFAGPGGPETDGDSDGGPGLDLYSAEFSVYNDLNWRNPFTRKTLNLLLSSHTNQFGYFSAGAFSSGTVASANVFGASPAEFPLGSEIVSSSVNALNYAGTASIHKVNRNTTFQGLNAYLAPFDTDLAKPGVCDGLGISSRFCQYDNYYVQHAIPSTDFGYAWIRKVFGPTATLSTYPDLVGNVSASDVGSWQSSGERWYGPDKYNPVKGYLVPSAEWLFVDFAGINSNIYDPISYGSDQLHETFTSQSQFAASKGLDPNIWNMSFTDFVSNRGRDMELRMGTGSTQLGNWIFRMGGLDEGVLFTPRWIETVQSYQAPLTVIFKYCQGAFEHESPFDGYDLKEPSEEDQDLEFLYSLDDGETWLTQSTFEPTGSNQGDVLVTAGASGFLNHTTFFPASSGSVKFRWQQNNYVGALLDNWGLGDVQILDSSQGYNRLGYVPFFQNGNPTGIGDPQTTDYAYQGGLVFGAGHNQDVRGLVKILNGLILHRQGPYGWPSWKQTRMGQHPIARYWDGNSRGSSGQHRNLFCYTTYKKTTNPAPVGRWIGPNDYDGSPDRFVIENNCDSSAPLTINYTGLLSYLVEKETPDGAVVENQVTLDFEYENNLGYFPYDSALNEEMPSFYDVDTSPYTYLTSLYLPPGAMSSPNNPVSGFIEMVYRAPLFPSDVNRYASVVRGRQGFKNTFWRGSRTMRTAEGFNKFLKKDGDD